MMGMVLLFFLQFLGQLTFSVTAQRRFVLVLTFGQIAGRINQVVPEEQALAERL